MASAAEADRLKQEGNEWFKLCKFQRAVDSYTAALEQDRNATILCNRAFAYIKLECAGAAIADAEEALKLDPSFVKAYYRKASAHVLLGKVKEAFRDFKHVVTMCPDDADARTKLAQCEKEVKRIAFINAIAREDSIPLSERLKLSDIAVPATYVGPRIPETGLTKAVVQEIAAQFKAEKHIARKDMCWLLIEVLNVFKSFPNVVPVEISDSEEITVCGDTHGQYYDLLNIFEKNGWPSETNPYIFNGDFVDRGSYSVETVTLLLAFKVLYPQHLFMSRGNHEAQGLNRVYGFEGEVKAKYDDVVYNLFQEVFCALPLGHTINKRVFITHGGLFSKNGVTIEQIQQVNRFRDIPEDGLMCEMLWSDPQPFPGRGPSKRGVGVAFGPDVTEDFLKTNGMELVVRSHEVKDDGYVVEHGGKCITIFSAPNYCDQIGNQGAFIRFSPRDGLKPKFTSFKHVPHPGKRPMAYSSAVGMM